MKREQLLIELDKIKDCFSCDDDPHEVYSRAALTEAINLLGKEPVATDLCSDGLCADNPVLNEDGSLHQFTLNIEGKPYRCKCGCNVFHKPNKEKLMVYQCNSCKEIFETE